MTKRKSNFRDKVVHNAHKQQSAKSEYGYLRLPQGVSVFSPKPSSKVRLDFLPYKVTDPKHPDRDDELGIAVPGSLWYKRPFKIHRNVGVNDATIICPTSFGKPCPICEYRKKRLKEGAEKQETDAMKASRRTLYAVIPINDPDNEEKIHVWDMSWWLFQKLLNEELEDNPEYGAFPDLEDGYTLRIRFSSDSIGKGDPFARASNIQFIPREDAYDEDILKNVPNLDEMVSVLSYEQIQAMFFEEEEVISDESTEELEETKEEQAPTPQLHRHPKTTKKQEEEEPEPKKPMRRQRRPREEKKPEPEEQKCPYGHIFGEDNDAFDDCDDCPLYNECAAAYDKL